MPARISSNWRCRASPPGQRATTRSEIVPARLMERGRNAVLLVGFQAAGTRGRLLSDGADELKIQGQYVPVRSRVVQVQALSAHADYAELLDWLRKSEVSPRRAFVTHGEPAAADAFRRRLRDELGWNAVVPADASTWTLD